MNSPKIFQTLVFGDVRVNVRREPDGYSVTIAAGQKLRRETIVHGAETEELAIEAAAKVIGDDAKRSALGIGPAAPERSKIIHLDDINRAFEV
jgi:hypothetical protein